MSQSETTQDPSVELPKEYVSLKNSYKDNYEIVDFYPLDIQTKNIGCASKLSPLNFKKLDNKLHTPESCKTAVALSNPTKLEYNSREKKQGLFCTVTLQNKTIRTHTATNLSSLSLALNNIPQNEILSAVWKGTIVADVEGKWSIELRSNDSIHAWIDLAHENMTEYNATLKDNTSKNITMVKNRIVPICIQWNKSNKADVNFSLMIKPPNTSIYSDPNKMFDCLFSYMNKDGTLYEPSPLYYSLIENSKDDTKQNLFQCHYSTSLGGTKVYNINENNSEFSTNNEEIIIPTSITLPSDLIKPGNSMKTDDNGAHIFNSQNVNVLTLIKMNIRNNTYMNGLAFTLYNGYFADNVNWFNTATTLTINGRNSGFTETISSIRAGTDSLIPVNGRDNYSVQWIGQFYANASGTWTFFTSSDNASYLWIGDNALSGFTTSNALVNNGGLHGMRERSGTITLSEGTLYPIRIQFGERGGGDNIIVSFTPPGGTKTTNGTDYYYPLTSSLSQTSQLKLTSIENNDSVQCVLELVGSNNKPTKIMSSKKIPLSKVAKSQKWNLERQSNNISDTASEIYFGKPLITPDCRFRLSFTDSGNFILHSSQKGCQTMNNSSVQYSTPESSTQYIYSINADEKRNNTYYVDKKDKTIQYLPRDNPMLSNLDTYTPLNNYIPSSDIIQNAKNVSSEDECKKMCNDNSGCSWYYTYRDNAANVQKCLIGNTSSSTIVSPDLINPVESGNKISSASLNIRNKNILPNKDYMTDNIIPAQLKTLSEFNNYAEYSVNSTPISGIQKTGFLSEKDVQEFLEKQRNYVLATNHNQTTSVKEGMAILAEGGKLQEVRKDLDETKRKNNDYNRNLSKIVHSQSGISDYIDKYKAVNADMVNQYKNIYNDNNDETKNVNSHVFNYYRPQYIKDRRTLASGIMEDNEEIIREQKMMYFTTGIAMATLAVAGFMIASRARE